MNDHDDDRDGLSTDEFSVEPWTVVRIPGALTVTDLTPAWHHYLSALGVAAVAVGLAGGTWMYCGPGRLGNFGWPAVAMGFFSGVMLLFKSYILILKGRRGSVRYVFDVHSETASLNDQLLGPWSELAVEIETRTFYTGTPGHSNDPGRREYEVRFRKGDDVHILGVFAAEASAERLAVAIADYAGTPLNRV